MPTKQIEITTRETLLGDSVTFNVIPLGQLGIHPTLHYHNHLSTTWSVTHLASGRAVIMMLPSWRDAVRFINDVRKTQFDFDAYWRDKTQCDHFDKLAKVVRKYRITVGGLYK